MFFKRLISFVILIVLLASLPVSAAGYKDFEWKDSPETVWKKFGGELIELNGFNDKIENNKIEKDKIKKWESYTAPSGVKMKRLVETSASDSKSFFDESPTPNVNYMLGETSLDGKPYAIKFAFFEDKLINIKLIAKSKYEDSSPEVMPNRPVDKFKGWKSESEHDEILRKLSAKNGRGDDSMNPMTTWDSNSNSIYLFRIGDYI